MIKIKSNGEIRLTRGDSAYITIKVNDSNGNPYVLSDDDVLRCQVRSLFNDDDNQGLLFSGTITDNGNGTATWHIVPEDTAHAVLPEKYYYDIQLEIGDDVFTIASGKFRILNEVTLKEGV